MNANGLHKVRVDDAIVAQVMNQRGLNLHLQTQPLSLGIYVVVSGYCAN